MGLQGLCQQQIAGNGPQHRNPRDSSPAQEVTKFVGQLLACYVGQKVDAAAARLLLLSQLRDGLMVQMEGLAHLQAMHGLDA